MLRVIRLPLTGVKIPKIGKRGFRSQKTPISPHTRKGRLESKTPHFPCGALYRNGDFSTRDPFSDFLVGNGGFLTPKPSLFPILGILTPVRGKRIRNVKASSGAKGFGEGGLKLPVIVGHLVGAQKGRNQMEKPTGFCTHLICAFPLIPAKICGLLRLPNRLMS